MMGIGPVNSSVVAIGLWWNTMVDKKDKKEQHYGKNHNLLNWSFNVNTHNPEKFK